MMSHLTTLGTRIYSYLQEHPRSTGLLTGILLTACAVLLIHLSQTIAHVRDVTLPMLAQVPDLERRVHTIESQLDIAHMTASERLPVLEENLAVYVLPEHSDAGRLVQIFDTLSGVLEQTGYGEIDSISIENNTVTIKGAMHEHGIDLCLQLLDTAGRLSIADALDPERIEELLHAIEHSNPVHIVALEKLFSMDLFQYSSSTRAAEDGLIRRLGKEEGEAILDVLSKHETLMQSVAFLQSDTGKRLHDKGLWPLPLLSLYELERTPGGSEGWFRVEMVVKAHVRN